MIELQLLHSMKRIRQVEETIAERYSENKMRCPTHLSTGQEAVAAATGLSLRSDDFAVSTHRAHAHYLGKGGSLKRMMAEIFGKADGCCLGKGGSMHLIDLNVGFMGSTAIVAGSIPIGVGLGLSIQLQKKDQVSCIFLGDGAIEEGAFYEAANFAALRKLPVLFICENNMYSVYSPLSVRQPKGREIHKLVEAIGIPSEKHDGSQALAVSRVIEGKVAAIRTGAGPQFLEFSAYRWREHCGPNFDNDIGYRTEEEYLFWKKRDPLLILETDLLEKGLLTRTSLDEMERTIQIEINEAFLYAENSPFPEPSTASQGLFKE